MTIHTDSVSVFFNNQEEVRSRALMRCDVDMGIDCIGGVLISAPSVSRVAGLGRHVLIHTCDVGATVWARVG